MKSRLAKAMEAHGVTTDELKTVLDKLDLFNFGYPTNHLNRLIERLLSDEDILKYGDGYLIIAVALLCNTSTDYLLGLSDVINPTDN